MNKIKILCATGLFALTCGVATAADFDGSKPLLCSMATFSECVPGGTCDQVTSESINAPDFVRIDFRKKTLTFAAAGQDDRPPASIKNRASIDGKLFLQGADDGLEGVRDGVAWSVAIDQDTGKLVLTPEH